MRWLPVGVVLVAAACGADDQPGAERAAPPPSTVLAPEGYPITHVADRQEARLELISPDWLVADGSSVWVKGDDGGVEQVDPGTNEVVKRIQNEGAHCSGLGVGFGSVWTCSTGGGAQEVARFDATTGERSSALPLVQSATQGHLATGFGKVWVLTGDGSTLVGVDPETEAVSVSVELGVRAADVGTGGAGLWVVSTLDDQVLRIDPDDGEILLMAEVLKPVSLSVTEQVWVGAARSTERLDPGTGEVLVTSEIGTGANGSIAVTDDAVWVRSADRFLVRLDPEDGRPVEGISSPDTPSAGSVIVAFGSLWTTAYDDGALFRIALPD